MFFFRSIHRKLDIVLARLGHVERDTHSMTKELEDLKAQVQANTDAEQSAITLLKSLSDQLTAAADDPAAVRALADQLKSSGDSLAAAIVANTRAAHDAP